MSYDTVIQKILEYTNMYLFPPSMNWSKHEFMVRTYSRWAAFEIIDLLSDHPFNDPIELIENYIFKLECLKVIAAQKHTELIFNTACDTAADLLYFVQMKGEVSNE